MTLLMLRQWPGVAGEVNPPNAALRLYGGAAFERALREFQLAVETLEFPRGARLSLKKHHLPLSSWSSQVAL